MTPDERMIDIGGQRLFLRCLGEGTPAVIFDAGLGDTADEWLGVQHVVAEFTRACAYDRAGLGHSGPGKERRPRTAERMVDELHALLAAAEVPAPYVLVGHSAGGLVMQLFAARYPAEVAGLVLVDSAHERHLAWLGQQQLPFAVMQEQRRFAGGENPEGFDLVASAAQVGATHWRLDAPLVVLMRGRVPPEEQPPEWSAEREQRLLSTQRALQAELATRSPRGELIVAERSGHYVHHHQPELVIDAIRRVVEAARV